MNHYQKNFGVKRLITSAYHPQTNGLCERMNGQIVMRLSKNCVNENKNDWDECLDKILFSIRIQKQKSPKFHHFFYYLIEMRKCQLNYQKIMIMCIW